MKIIIEPEDRSSEPVQIKIEGDTSGLSKIKSIYTSQELIDLIQIILDGIKERVSEVSTKVFIMNTGRDPIGYSQWSLENSNHFLGYNTSIEALTLKAYFEAESLGEDIITTEIPFEFPLSYLSTPDSEWIPIEQAQIDKALKANNEASVKLSKDLMLKKRKLYEALKKEFEPERKD